MSDTERTLWVGNLSEKITEDLLYELFLQVGPLERVIIPKAKAGKTSFYAFVVFKHVESVAYAIRAMELVRLYGKKLTLNPKSNGMDNRDVNRKPPLYRGSPQFQHPGLDRHNSLPVYNMNNSSNDPNGNYNNFNPVINAQSPLIPANSQGWFNQQMFMPSQQVDVSAIRNRLMQSTRLISQVQHGRAPSHRQHREKFYDRDRPPRR